MLGGLGAVGGILVFAPYLLLASIGSNGVGVSIGAGLPPGTLAEVALPVAVGYGVLDRETGEVRRWLDFTDAVNINTYLDEVSIFAVTYDVAVNTRGQVALALGPFRLDT